MRASDLRTNGRASTVAVGGTSRRQPSLSAAFLVVGLLVALLLAALIWHTRPVPATEPELLPGVRQALAGANRVLLRDYPDRTWLSYWEQNRVWLGDPVWPERQEGVYSSCVGFELYVVCRSSNPRDWGTVWEYQPLLLGTLSLPPGVLPNPQAEIAPIVHGYIQQLQEDGQDPWYWLGAIQSPRYCPPGAGECLQYFQRQVLRWKTSATKPEEVMLSRLGAEYQSARR